MRQEKMLQSNNILKTIRAEHPNWEFPEFSEYNFKKKSSEYVVLVFVINEGQKIRNQIKKMENYSKNIDIVIADGGSIDGSLEQTYLKKHHVRTLLIKKGTGKLSAQMRMAFAWAIHEGYKGVIVVDGNDKDDISAIPEFVRLLSEGYDHIQGSRYIPGGKAINTPKTRHFGLKLIHAPLISLASRKKQTDTTNGFRAYSSKLITDSEIAVFRDVFQTYELHYYLAIESGRRKKFKTIETPVIRSYPKKGKTPTKISPIKGNLHLLTVLFKAVTNRYRKR
jgi:dolichol-phosphate mannosyltransferase